MPSVAATTKEMPTPPDKTQISVYLDPPVKDALAALAKKHKRSMNAEVSLLVEEAIAKAKQSGELP